MIGQSNQNTLSFKLGEDFYSISFFSYILIDRPLPLILNNISQEEGNAINDHHIEEDDHDETSPLTMRRVQEEVQLTEPEVA